MLSLNAATRDLILRAERRQEFLHRVLQLRHRQRHALADIDRDHDLERRAFRREVADGLRHAVFEQLERGLLQAGDESTAIGDDRGDLHDVDRHLLDLIEALGARAGDDAPAADQVGDDAKHVRPHFGAGVPLAFGRDRIEHVADLLAVGEEQDLRDARRQHLRKDFGFELRQAADVGIRFRQHHADRQFRRWLRFLRRRAPTEQYEKYADSPHKLHRGQTPANLRQPQKCSRFLLTAGVRARRRPAPPRNLLPATAKAPVPVASSPASRPGSASRRRASSPGPHT